MDEQGVVRELDRIAIKCLIVGKPGRGWNFEYTHVIEGALGRIEIRVPPPAAKQHLARSPPGYAPQ